MGGDALPKESPIFQVSAIMHKSPKKSTTIFTFPVF